jgi:hypothetical protein
LRDFSRGANDVRAIVPEDRVAGSETVVATPSGVSSALGDRPIDASHASNDIAVTGAGAGCASATSTDGSNGVSTAAPAGGTGTASLARPTGGPCGGAGTNGHGYGPPCEGAVVAVDVGAGATVGAADAVGAVEGRSTVASAPLEK